MSERKIDTKKEFGKIARKYREHFGFGQREIGDLSGLKQPEYSNIENGGKNIGIERADQVAAAYGLRYYEMSNPKFPIPDFADLPAETQAKIVAMRDKPKKNRDYKNDLAGELDKIIESGFISQPRTAEEIWQQLPEELRKKVKPVRISDLLGKEPRKSMVTKIRPLPGTGRAYRFIVGAKA